MKFLKPRLVVSSSLILFLLLLLIFRPFLVFHARLTSNPISDRYNASFLNHASTKIRHREPNAILYALREEIRHDPQAAGNGNSGTKPSRKWVKPVPSLEQPPLNMTQEERMKWFRESFASFKVLHSDSMSGQFSAKVKPFFKPCKLRFFMTWISPIESFGSREWLSIESVFKWNPSCCLLVISRTMDSEAGEEILRPFRNRGFRVMAAAPDLRYLFKKTPAEEWLRKVESGDIDPGEVSFAQNLSNILRLAALYKFGGVYIDADVILLRNFSGLRNAIGAQNRDSQTGRWNRLNNAVLAFDKRHPLLFKFIQEFALTFDGNKWGHNGPYLVTRVVTRVANRTGYEFKIMPPIAFYPVDWSRIYSYFISPSDREHAKWRSAKIMHLEKEGYAIHLWNKQSRGLNVEKGSIMHHIFHNHCIFCHSVL
jgi:lactosylceramide 4-alpha-galactosyltransferase